MYMLDNYNFYNLYFIPPPLLLRITVSNKYFQCGLKGSYHLYKTFSIMNNILFL